MLCMGLEFGLWRGSQNIFTRDAYVRVMHMRLIVHDVGVRVSIM